MIWQSMAESNSVKTLEIRYLAMFVSLSIVNFLNLEAVMGSKVVCTFLGSQRRGEARLCVSRLSPSDLLPVTPDLLYVTRTQHSWPASPFSWGKCWVHSLWGSWDAPFLVVLVTHWPQGWIPAFRKRVFFSLQHWTSHSSQSPFISAKAWSEKQYF